MRESESEREGERESERPNVYLFHFRCVGNDDISRTDNIECLSIYLFSSPLKRYYLQNTTALTVNSEGGCGDDEADHRLRQSTVRCTYSIIICEYCAAKL